MAVNNEAVFRSGIKLGNGVSVNQILDESDFSTNSAEAIPTQSSVKSYVDAAAGVAGSDGQLQYNNGGSAFGGASQLYYDDLNNRLGVGTATPSYAFEISSSSASGAASALAITKAYNSSMGPYIWFFKARGTVASKANIAANDALMIIGTQAWINSGWVSGTYINSEVVSTHTTYFAADITFDSRNSSNVMAERMRITSTNRVGIGTNSPGGTLGLLDSNTYITRDGSNNLSFTDAVTGTKTLAQLAAGTAPSGSENYVQLNLSSSFGSDSNFRFDADQNRLIVGPIPTASAVAALHVSGTSQSAAMAIVQMASATPVGPSIAFRNSRGTLSSPTATQDGDALGLLEFEGYNGSGFYAGASMYAKASQTWTTGAHGTDLYWSTTREGETSPTVSMVLSYDGFLGIGTDAPLTALYVSGAGTSNGESTITSNCISNSAYGPSLVLEKSRGTSVSLASGDYLGYVFGSGSIGNIWTYYEQVGLLFQTTEAWSSSNRGARIAFHTTPSGSTTRSEVATFSDEGYLGLGTETPIYRLVVHGTNQYDSAAGIINSATAGSPTLRILKSRGTPTSPTAVVAGDRLGDIHFGGYDSNQSGYVTGASIYSEAVGDWTGGAKGAGVVIAVTPVSSSWYEIDAFQIDSEGHVGIGDSATRITPTAALHIEGDYTGWHCNQVMKGYCGSTATWAPSLYIYKARGTQASPTAVIDNDRLALFAAGGYDGTSWGTNGYIIFLADGTWTTSSHMTRLEFYTGQVNEISSRLRMTIYGNGEIWMPPVWGVTATSPRTMYIQSNGKLGGISSTRRHKKNIKVMRDIDFLYDLRPVNFVFKKDAAQETQYGLIAEEVEKVNKDFVFYNDDKIAGVHYDRLISVLIKADQEQKKRGESMEKTIESLTEKVTTLQNKLNKLSGKGTTNTKQSYREV